MSVQDLMDDQTDFGDLGYGAVWCECGGGGPVRSLTAICSGAVLLEDASCR